MPAPRRRLVWLLLGTVAILAGGRLAAVEGVFSVVRVLGPSMAPTLWGPSYQRSCPACQASLRVHDHPANPLPSALRCQHCGERVTLAEVEAVAGEPVLIDRAAYWWHSPRRGDWVAIRREGAPWQVKRIVGLPGDTLTLQGDALRINAQPIDRLLRPETIPRIDVFTAPGTLFFPVSDETLSEASDEAADEAASEEPAAAESFGNAPHGGRWQPSPEGIWQVYHHRSIHDAPHPAPIRDDFPANTAVARQLHPVPQIGLAGTLRSSQTVVLEVAIWQAEGAVYFRGGFPAGETTWSVSRLAAAGVTQMLHPAKLWERVSHPAGDIAVPAPVALEHPVAVRIEGGPATGASESNALVRLSALRVFRHWRWYVRPRELSRWPAEPIQLAPDRYFVLGDNVPLSDDSRAAPTGVPRTEIVGRVLRRPAWVPFP